MSLLARIGRLATRGITGPPVLSSYTYASAIQQAADAEARAMNQEARAVAAEDLLLELVRGVETAPMSRYIDPTTLECVRPGAPLVVPAPHLTWRPLSAALDRAHAHLDGQTRG